MNSSTFIPPATTSYSMDFYLTKRRRSMPFRLRKIKRRYEEEWHDAIRLCYEDIKGDAPPKRLQKRRRELMSLLRKVLKQSKPTP